MSKLLNIFKNNAPKQVPIPSGISQNISLTDEDISIHIDENIGRLKELFRGSFDLILREFTIGDNPDTSIKCAVVFLNGLTAKEMIEQNILQPIILNTQISKEQSEKGIEEVSRDIMHSIVTIMEIVPVYKLEKAVNAILSGKSVFFVDQLNLVYDMDTRGWRDRSVSEPTTESVVRGSREGYTETLITNTALLRRRLKTPDLTLEVMQIGALTQTDVVVGYIKNIVDEGVLDEVKKRLQTIDVDAILDSGYIEQYIEDRALSLFHTIGNTEKPDVTAAKLLEGKVVIMVDGSPNVLTVPCLFIESFQTCEDYYMRPWYASFIRLIRLLSFFIVLYLPGFYVAVQTFHQDLLPTHLFITMAASKEGVPFPSFLEIFIMAIVYEVLKDAGVRMPKPIGQAVSIVGALVLGEAAVNAGFVSNPAVMITAISGIAGFVIYSLNDSLTILKIILIILGAFSGFYGIVIGSLFILIHLLSIKSFGVPYLSPIAPRNTRGLLKDTAIRAPLWILHPDPNSISWQKAINIIKHKFKINQK
jgi:spore germination protein KA